MEPYLINIVYTVHVQNFIERNKICPINQLNGLDNNVLHLQGI